MRINYIYKKESDIDKFIANNSAIELKEYMDDLILYSPLNSNFRAEYALYDKIACFDKTPDIYTGGPFGSYLKIKDKFSFNIKNFDPITKEARISFWVSPNKIMESSKIALVPKENFPEEGLPAGDYSINVQVEGQPNHSFTFKIKEGSNVSAIKNKMFFKLEDSYNFSINTANTENKILLQSSVPGKRIQVFDGVDGNNLLDYFNADQIEYGSAPETPIEFFKLFNFSITHFKNTETGEDKSYLRFKIKSLDNETEDDIVEIPWNTDSVRFDNIEVDFDGRIMYVFINGKLEGVKILDNKFINNGQTLELYGTEENVYSFDEIIINKKYKHTKDFETSKTQLTKYTTEKPYIDYYFSEVKKGMKLNSLNYNNIYCCLCDNGNFYYYNNGAWRSCGGFENHLNDFATFASKIETYDFSSDNFFIRCYFVSDGLIKAFIDTPYFEISNADVQDEDGNTAAILIGTKEWSNEDGEPIKENLADKELVIETDQGTTSIVFPEKETSSEYKFIVHAPDGYGYDENGNLIENGDVKDFTRVFGTLESLENFKNNYELFIYKNREVIEEIEVEIKKEINEVKNDILNTDSNIPGNTDIYYEEVKTDQNPSFINYNFISDSSIDFSNIKNNGGTVSGSYIWNDGENVYYSFSSSLQFMLNKETNKFEPAPWIDKLNINRQYIWKYDGDIYHSAPSPATPYKFDKEAKTWTPITWTNRDAIIGSRIWISYSNKCYFGAGGSWKIFDKSTNSWNIVNLNISGNTMFAGEHMWFDGETDRYDYMSYHYIFDKVQNEFVERKEDIGVASLDGANIWHYNDDIYYTSANKTYKFDKKTKKFNEITFGRNSPTAKSNICYINNKLYNIANDNVYKLISNNTKDYYFEVFDGDVYLKAKPEDSSEFGYYIMSYYDQSKQDYIYVSGGRPSDMTRVNDFSICKNSRANNKSFVMFPKSEVSYDSNGNIIYPKAIINKKTIIPSTLKSETYEEVINEDEKLYSINDTVDYINSYYPDGIAECSKDSKEKVYLISETKGKEAYIKVSGEAAPIIFGGDISEANGTDKNDKAIDYSKFYDAVRNYTGAPLISMEISDEQMKLYMKEALYYYKKWKGNNINQYTCQLKGDYLNGYEIPSVIEQQSDIVDIIFKPIFPITFYGSDFIDNGNENIFALTFANYLLGGRGTAGGFGNISQDYYISLMSLQDFKQALGLNPTWEVVNGRIFIYPNRVSRFTNVCIRYKAPLSEEDALKNPDIIKYVHGKCLMGMSLIRSQYNGNLTTGESGLTFDNTWYEKGKVLVDTVVENWKKEQPPLGFFFG